MIRSGFAEGTHHVTYLHAEDDRRHKNRCEHHGIGRICKCTKRKCHGAAHCDAYIDGPYKTRLKDKADTHEAIQRYEESKKMSQKEECLEVVIRKEIPGGIVLFEKGRWVMHKVFGVGVIRDSDGQFVHIDFPGGTNKKFKPVECLNRKFFIDLDEKDS